MSVTVSYGSLLSFLGRRLNDESTPTTDTTGLCLLAGGIVGRNLEDALARRGKSTAGLSVSTIEATATELLNLSHRRRTDTPDPVEILDQQLCEQLLVDTITSPPESESLEAVEGLLSGFDWAGRPTLRETLWKELDRYFRMTDAGGDHEAAVGVAVDLAERDPYAGSRSRQALTAFQELHTALQQRTADLPETGYLSRSHLVSAAREALATDWEACYPDVEWVAVDTISVLDNPTLRFFEALAILEDGPDIYLFGTEAGAGSRLSDRLSSAGLDPTVITGSEADQPHVGGLMDTVRGEPPAEMPTVEFIEAPDGRRELDHVAGQIRKLTGMGVDSKDSTETTCADILIAAKDVIPYRSRIADVFTSHGIPTHIEARQPLMQTGGYRYLRAVFDLLAAVDGDEPIAPHDLVDPLRLGFCLPETVSRQTEPTAGEWPADGEAVAEIETRVAAGVATEADGRLFDDWRRFVRREFGDDETALHTFLEWVDETATGVPETTAGASESGEAGEAVVDLIESLLAAHLTALTNRGVRRPTGPGVDGTRTALTTKHDSHAVGRLREHADRVGSYVEQAISTDLGESGWELAAEAVRQICGSGSYWPRNADGNAVRIVNAANAHYAEADHVFVIGLAAEEFPADRSPPTVFHEDFYRALRAAAAEAPTADPAGYLQAPTTRSQFEGDVDEYRAAIGAAAEGVWLCRQFRNTDGETVRWSGFVDAYTSRADAEVNRIATDEWLPAVESDGDLTAIDTATPRDRLRLLSATFPGGIDAAVGRSTAALTDREAIVDLLSRADGDAYSREIEPRRRRYFGEDGHAVTVRPDEPMFSGGSESDIATRSLAERAGPPVSLHELDLYANCQRKYYFRQYFEWDAAGRDSPAGLPAPIRERYPASAFIDGLRRLITSTDRLANRQAALGQFDTLGEFRDQLASWIETDPTLDSSLMQPLLGEYRAVQQELSAGIDREWRWEPAATVQIDGHAVRVPGHRVDVLPESRFSIPIWYTGADGAADRVVSQSLPSEHVVSARDHRLLLGADDVDPFGGSLVCDPTSAAASAPQGVIIGGDLNPIPAAVPDGSNLTRISRSEWEDHRGQWWDRAGDQLETMTAVEESITYRVSEDFVDNGGCVGCDYRDLCQLPASRQRGNQ